MKQAFAWIWKHGIVSTFLAGFLVLLPLAITLWIIDWVVDVLRGFLGPDTYVGEGLRYLGLRFVTNAWVATILGWAVVILAIWLLGLLVKSTTRLKVVDRLNRAMMHVPVVRAVYGPVAQVVALFRQQPHDKLKAMSVIYCVFGEKQGGGFLALLASERLYRFGAQDCHLVYIPTSPLPMTGGLIFVPATAIQHVDMSIEALMEFYFSMGVMAAEVVPGQFQVPQKFPKTEEKISTDAVDETTPGTAVGDPRSAFGANGTRDPI
jgi:uncharacterized membrane protein